MNARMNMMLHRAVDAKDVEEMAVRRLRRMRQPNMKDGHRPEPSLVRRIRLFDVFTPELGDYIAGRLCAVGLALAFAWSVLEWVGR